MTIAEKKHRMSIKDYTVTLDTQRSRDDMLVLRLDPLDGSVPALVLPFGAQQLCWAIQDPEYFEGGYKTWLATNILDVLAEQGWSLEQIATALDVPITTALKIHAKAVADAAERAAQGAELAEAVKATV